MPRSPRDGTQNGGVVTLEEILAGLADGTVKPVLIHHDRCACSDCAPKENP